MGRKKVVRVSILKTGSWRSGSLIRKGTKKTGIKTKKESLATLWEKRPTEKRGKTISSRRGQSNTSDAKKKKKGDYRAHEINPTAYMRRRHIKIKKNMFNLV